MQLWHTGRVAHPDFTHHPSNANKKYQTCVSASDVPITNRRGEPAKTVTYNGAKPHGVPRPLDAKVDIPRLCQDYKHAAQCAKDAGFDGVELHAAHGYLIDQFLNNGTNKRTDEYGGSPQNRCRLLREVLDSIFEVWPSERVGVRLSPHDSPNGGNTYYGSKDTNPDLVYHHAIQTLDQLNLAYLLVTEPRWVGKFDDSPETAASQIADLVKKLKDKIISQGTTTQNAPNAVAKASSNNAQASEAEGGLSDQLRWLVVGGAVVVLLLLLVILRRTSKPSTTNSKKHDQT